MRGKLKKLFSVLLVCFLSIHAMPSDDWRQSPYFNTKFLVQYDAVCHTLIEKEGFVEGFFPTEDSVSINYTWLKRPNARYTMIFCSGFWPGRKEGIATFYAMLPDDCNLLFFDARGHGKSKGRFLTKLWQYGAHEYKDVIGAACWAHKQQKCPIVIYGICAGAFHAAHAVLRMQERNMLNKLCVKGLIFDSGWSSIGDVSKTAFTSELNAFAYKKTRKWFKNYNTVYPPLSKVVRCGVNIFHTCIIRPALYWNKQTELFDKIGDLSLPTFYIHAECDDYAKIEPVKRLASQTKHATCWWISEQSKHACHHLKLKEQYRDRLLHFLEQL